MNLKNSGLTTLKHRGFHWCGYWTDFGMHPSYRVDPDSRAICIYVPGLTIYRSTSKTYRVLFIEVFNLWKFKSNNITHPRWTVRFRYAIHKNW